HGVDRRRGDGADRRRRRGHARAQRRRGAVPGQTQWTQPRRDPQLRNNERRTAAPKALAPPRGDGPEGQGGYMTEPVVLHEVSPDGVAVVTLNRPQAMNALSRALLDALANALQACSDDARVRVIILTGAGSAFCAGLDLKELGA